VRAAEEVIGCDDQQIYENELLRNINRYYFVPYLDERIPYKENVKAAVELRRNNLKGMIEDWNHLASEKPSKPSQTSLQSHLLSQHASSLPSYTSDLSSHLRPYLNYVNTFVTSLFSTLTLQDWE
jgi:hypothetical protein